MRDATFFAAFVLFLAYIIAAVIMIVRQYREDHRDDQ